MTDPAPTSRLKLRWAAIFGEVITFIWLPVEDQSILFLLLLSVGWSAWLAVWFFMRQNSSPVLKRFLWTGAGGGALVFPVAILLTVLKAGLHHHGFLDFSTTQLISIAKTVPLWVALGVILSLLRLKYHPEENDW